MITPFALSFVVVIHLQNRRFRLGAELLVQDGHVVVVLSLVEVARDRVAQVVLLGELGDREHAAVVARPVSKPRLIKLQLPRLLVDQENVSVQTSTLGRSGAYVLGQRLARCDVVAGNVSDQPVVPFAELRLLSGRRVGVSHCEGVQLVRGGIPRY